MMNQTCFSIQSYYTAPSDEQVAIQQHTKPSLYVIALIRTGMQCQNMNMPMPTPWSYIKNIKNNAMVLH